MCILDILTKRKAEGNEGYEDSWPAIDQIRGFKRRFNSESTDTEFEKVRELLNKLSGENRGLENLDEKSGFSYGIKMGTGADNDPVVACFTSKHLLKNISKHSNHYAVFHVDGTYKLIKNRFPVLVYGRPDMNGQLHLISIAIVSAETAELFKYFYR